MSCVFCGISKGEIPCYKIGENSSAIAFLDINPHALGHAVVVPKYHAENALGAEKSDWIGVFDLVKDVLLILKEKLQVDGFNIGWNEEKAAGQVVAHWHVHIFPRYFGDGGGSVHSIIKQKPELSVEEVYKKITG